VQHIQQPRDGIKAVAGVYAVGPVERGAAAEIVIAETGTIDSARLRTAAFLIVANEVPEAHFPILL
jgi:hypothetical protein